MNEFEPISGKEGADDLETQFNNPEIISIEGQEFEVVDISPAETKTEMPVVFAPGWGLGSKNYKKNILGLAKAGRRVLCFNVAHGLKTETPELPGVEENSAIELRKTMALIRLAKEKGLSRFDVVGHSEAGIYVIFAALLEPERFRNIVLVNPTGTTEPVSARKQTFRFSKDLVLQTLGGLFKGKKEALNVFWDTIRYMRSDQESSDKEAVANAQTQTLEFLEKVKEKGIGVSIIHSAGDRIFPISESASRLKKEHVTGYYAVTGGHDDVFLDPEIRTKLIDQALDSLEKKNA